MKYISVKQFRCIDHLILIHKDIYSMAKKLPFTDRNECIDTPSFANVPEFLLH